MNYNHIKQFLNKYQHCPLCDTALDIRADSKLPGKMNFLVATTPYELIIKINSDFFVEKQKKEFEFSISIKDGNILHCNLANQFVSLYDLNIILFKICPTCKPRGEGFFRSINLFYDRTESVFTANPHLEWFCFYYGAQNYFFLNDYRNMSSTLKIGFDYEFRNAGVQQNAPYIPFEKFDFKNRYALFGKINAVQLLI